MAERALIGIVVLIIIIIILIFVGFLYGKDLLGGFQKFWAQMGIFQSAVSTSTDVEFIVPSISEDMSTIDKIGNFTANFRPYKYRRYEIPGYQAPADYGYGYFLFKFKEGESYLPPTVAERVKAALLQWYGSELNTVKEEPHVESCQIHEDGSIDCPYIDGWYNVTKECFYGDKTCKYCKNGFKKYENGYCYYSQKLSNTPACCGYHFGECNCLTNCYGWTLVPGNLNCRCCPESTLYYDEQGASDAPYGKCYYIEGLSFDVNYVSSCPYNDFNTGGGKVANITVEVKENKPYNIGTNLTMFIKLNGTYEYGFVPHIIICYADEVK
jgi:hypothetical protein